MKRAFGSLAAAVLLIWPVAGVAEKATLAVAANFLPAAEVLVEAFEAQSEHEIALVHGSTGQIFAQISTGAPFDIFLAADAARPAELRKAGLSGDVRTYALGQLVLISRHEIDIDAPASAFAGERVALADPLVAPYGLAATSSMESLGLNTAEFKPLLVANVAQAATLFATGNADIAFVAASLLPKLTVDHAFLMEGRHPSIRQDAALMTRATDNDAAQAFWAFLFSKPGRELIAQAGYTLP